MSRSTSQMVDNMGLADNPDMDVHQTATTTRVSGSAIGAIRRPLKPGATVAVIYQGARDGANLRSADHDDS
jgi:hypothetical protein